MAGYPSPCEACFGDISEAEGREALESTVAEACREIEQRQAACQRQTRKASLIQQCVEEVSTYLLELKQAQEISADDYWDTEFNTDPTRGPCGCA